MLHARFTVSVVLGIMSAWVIVSNWYGVFCGVVLRRTGYSWAPIVGGLLGAIAIAVLPIRGITKWCWLPFIVDFGCLPVLILTIIAYALTKKK